MTHSEGPTAEVVTLGEPLGLFLAPPGVPARAARTFELGVTGAELNVVVGLSRLGHRCRFLGRVGADAVGGRVLAELGAEGVDRNFVTVDPARPTGLIVRDTMTDRPIDVGYHRSGSAATALTPDDVPAAAFEGAALLHLTGITAALGDGPRAACREAVARARAAGARVSFDPNVRSRLAGPEQWREIVEEFAGLSDVVLAGADDVSGCGVDTDPLTWLHSLGTEHVVVKRGAAGATESRGGHERVDQAAHRVTALDPVGAGDAFAVGWLSAWLRSVDPPERMREAAVVAAAAVASRGDQPGLPTADVRDQMLRAGADVTR